MWGWCCSRNWMAIVHEIIDLVVCRKIHGCGCVADNPPHGKVDKTSVTVFHPNRHPILKGWWDLEGPCIWQFSLTASLPPPLHLPPLASIAGELSAATSAFLPHPSQCFGTTSTTGEDIQVVFLQEATQSMAMTAQASSTS